MINKIRIITIWIAAFAIALIGLPVTALSQQTVQRPYRINDKQLERIIRRIEQRTNTFSRHLDNALDRSRLDGTDREDEINAYVEDFEKTTNYLRDRFNNRQSVVTDVQMVLNSSVRINQFMRNNTLNRTVQNDWTLLRRDLAQLARAYNVAWNWNKIYNPDLALRIPYGINDRQVDSLLRRIDTRAESFKRSLDRALDESKFDGTQREDEINRFVSVFNDNTKRLRERFDDRNSVAADVEKVLNSAASINNFMLRHSLNTSTQYDWSLLRTEMEELARVYNVSWNWHTPSPNVGTFAGSYTGDALLTGTFRINISRSDDPRVVAQKITYRMTQKNRQRVEDLIVNRFAPAEVIALERHGRDFSMETDRTPNQI